VWAAVECTASSDSRLVLHSFFRSGRTVTTAHGDFVNYRSTDDWRLSEQSWEERGKQIKFHR